MLIELLILTHSRAQNWAAGKLSKGNAYIMKRSSLCGRNEYSVINTIVTLNSFHNLRSNNNPIGIRMIVVRRARGIAEVKYHMKGIT